MNKTLRRLCAFAAAVMLALYLASFRAQVWQRSTAATARSRTLRGRS